MTRGRFALLVPTMPWFLKGQGQQQTGPFVTKGFQNGRVWKALTAAERSLYVIALQEGANMAVVRWMDNIQPLPKESDFNWLGSHVIGAGRLPRPDIVRELDTFYGSSDNIGIPIPFAYAFIAEKACGVGETELERYRQSLQREFR